MLLFSTVTKEPVSIVQWKESWYWDKAVEALVFVSILLFSESMEVISCSSKERKRNKKPQALRWN